MKLKQSYPGAGLVLLLLVATPLLAQPGGDTLRNSVGLRVGYSQPIGDWSKSPLVSSVSLIGGSLMVELDLDFVIARRVTLGIEGGFSTLNGSGWEEYAAGFGDRLEISGSFLHCAVLLRPHLLVKGENMVRLELGPAVVFAGGQEAFEGRTYQYDFLGGTSFGAKVGIEYVRLLTESLALSVRGSCMYYPSASQHTAASARSIGFVPLAVGIRFVL